MFEVKDLTKDQVVNLFLGLKLITLLIKLYVAFCLWFFFRNKFYV